MAAYKTPDFNERATAARAAKQRALDQLRDKPAPDAAAVAAQEESRAAREAARIARDAAAAERRAARQAAAEAAKAEKAARAAPPEPAKIVPEPVAEPAPERPKPSEAELKAARDARYAARKARKR